MVFAARGNTDASELEARKAGTDTIAWHVTLPGSAGPLAIGADVLVATLSVTGTVAGAAIGAPVAIHGEPGALVGAPATGAGFVVGGTFSGTLRVGDTALSANARTVVSSAGRNDGFVAELTTSGAVRWLVRVGGSGADSVQGVAARGDRVAIAGVFTAGAELLGEPLVAFDEKLPFADGFVAELDASGARRWQQTFGGKLDDAVAGIAIDSKNRVIVAATVRDSIRIGGRDLGTRGPADGLVAWFSPAGDLGSTTIIGGSEFDGLRAIAAIDDRVVVAGFFSGALALGKRALDASGGADSFLVDVNSAGELETSWHAAGPGREEITSLSSVPGGFVVGIAHTAALNFEEVLLPAPVDPASGAALVGRPAP